MRYCDIKPDHIGGFYPNAKVYFDGSHYVAIPHTEQPFRRHKKSVVKEVVEVADRTIVKCEKYSTDTIENVSFDSGTKNNEIKTELYDTSIQQINERNEYITKSPPN